MESRIKTLVEMSGENAQDPFIWHALGLEYYAVGKFEIALENFIKAMQVGKDYPPAAYQAGKTAFEMGRVNEATSLLQRGEIAAREKGDLKMAGEIAGLLWEIEE